jgi:arginyl-tRNA synthetase
MLQALALRNSVIAAMQQLYHVNSEVNDVVIQPTRKEFEGDLTVVVFGLAKAARKSPQETGEEIGNYLSQHEASVQSCNVVKGFLNVVINNSVWLAQFNDMADDKSFGYSEADSSFVHAPVLVEYSSPNTNKPLHLGHVRNILLGYSLAEILKATGNHVRKVNLVNDRGIHICKSMLAWLKRGNGETPESSGMKGDHLVGKYYVEFDKMYKEDVAAITAQGISEEEAKKIAPIMQEAQEMLRKWEANDVETVELWKKMNSWVYAGFNSTYDLMGVDFDKMYYESNTYILGKEIVKEGLDKGVFFKKEDGSVWVDLTDEGLDQKLLLRSDGTSVYITQDLGTSKLRHTETNFSRLIYVVGNEQDYHFKVLRLALKKLGYDWWDNLHHLSYAMVDLPSGKMKSREGTVVDADELMGEMISEAKRITKELGKIDDFESKEAEELYATIGLGALKYYILKVDPEKRMLFNPEESIDFNGHSGPFIQSTYVRCRSVLRKANSIASLKNYSDYDPSFYASLEPKERDLLKALLKYPEVLNEAADRFSPAIIAGYVYEIAKYYNGFYHEHSVADIENVEVSLFRLKLTDQTARIIKMALALLGINVPERM